jgi:hypothetical protein
MDVEQMEQLGDKGLRYYNSLREFYDHPDMMAILDYIIRYNTEEMKHSGIEDEEKFNQTVRRRGYMIVKGLYEANVKRLHEGECNPIPLYFPDDKEIGEAIKEEHSELEILTREK